MHTACLRNWAFLRTAGALRMSGTPAAASADRAGPSAGAGSSSAVSGSTQSKSSQVRQKQDSAVGQSCMLLTPNPVSTGAPDML